MYHQTKKDLVTAVTISLQNNQTGGLHRHPLYMFLTADHEIKRQYGKGEWLLYFLGSYQAGNTYKGNKLENNIKYIATMLYSIISITQDADAINILAGILGANAKASKGNRKKYLDTIVRDTV